VPVISRIEQYRVGVPVYVGSKVPRAGRPGVNNLTTPQGVMTDLGAQTGRGRQGLSRGKAVY
jgi:hypothetical protein